MNHLVDHETVRLRARVAELEARINSAADQIARLEVERWEFAEMCAAMDEALKPLAALSLRSDVVKDGDPDRWYGFIGVTHVKAARAARAMQTAPPTPRGDRSATSE